MGSCFSIVARQPLVAASQLFRPSKETVIRDLENYVDEFILYLRNDILEIYHPTSLSVIGVVEIAGPSTDQMDGDYTLSRPPFDYRLDRVDDALNELSREMKQVQQELIMHMTTNPKFHVTVNKTFKDQDFKVGISVWDDGLYHTTIYSVHEYTQEILYKLGEGTTHHPGGSIQSALGQEW